MIRRTQHNISYANKTKLDSLDSILTESRRVVNIFIDQLWTGSTVNVKFHTTKTDTWLSARMQQCLGKQALEIVKSQNKRKKKTKPTLNQDSFILDSRFVDIKEDENSFDLWFRLTSIGNKIRICLPSKKHKHYHKFHDWNKLNTIRLRKQNKKYYIDMFHETTIPKKITGKVTGLDCGYKKLLSDSNGNHYGIDLQPLYERLANKKRGSKNYQELIIHKTNEINRVINNLPLHNVNNLVIEDLKNVKYKSKLSTKFNNKLQYWTYGQVLRKLELLSEIKGFVITKVNPAYTSQTCSQCGVIDKRSRKGELFSCTTCGMEMDADTNGAINILHRGIYSSSAIKTKT